MAMSEDAPFWPRAQAVVRPSSNQNTISKRARMAYSFSSCLSVGFVQRECCSAKGKVGKLDRGEKARAWKFVRRIF